MSFLLDSLPVRSGDYTRYVTRPASTTPVGTGGVVALVYTDEWGPVGQVVEYSNWQDYLSKNGAPADPANPSEGFVAVFQAFKGGAGSVLGLRIAATGVGTASKVLAAGATPSALTITAKYPGTRGGKLKVETVANLASPTTQVDFRLYLNDVKVAEMTGVGATDVTALQDYLNRVASAYIVASGAVNGTKLDPIAATALTGGNDGLTLTAADYAGARVLLEPQRFGYVGVADLTDPSIKASFQAWAAGLNNAEKSKRLFLGLGGASGETFATAAAEASSYDDENTVRLGVGTFRDTILDEVLSTAQLVPRLLGAMSALGGRASLTNHYLDDLELVTGPSDAEIIASLSSGLIVLRLGQDGVAIERGVTSYVSDTAVKPFSTFSKVKYVTTMQNYEREGREVNEGRDGRLGKVVVNKDTRDALVASEQRRLDAYVLRDEIQPGARVVLSSDIVQTNDDDFVAIDVVGKYGRTLDMILRTVTYS